MTPYVQGGKLGCNKCHRLCRSFIESHSDFTYWLWASSHEQVSNVTQTSWLWATVGLQILRQSSSAMWASRTKVLVSGWNWVKIFYMCTWSLFFISRLTGTLLQFVAVLTHWLWVLGKDSAMLTNNMYFYLRFIFYLLVEITAKPLMNLSKYNHLSGFQNNSKMIILASTETFITLCSVCCSIAVSGSLVLECSTHTDCILNTSHKYMQLFDSV